VGKATRAAGCGGAGASNRSAITKAPAPTITPMEIGGAHVRNWRNQRLIMSC
jgi:hypothetical protein